MASVHSVPIMIDLETRSRVDVAIVPTKLVVFAVESELVCTSEEICLSLVQLGDDKQRYLINECTIEREVYNASISMVKAQFLIASLLILEYGRMHPDSLWEHPAGWAVLGLKFGDFILYHTGREFVVVTREQLDDPVYANVRFDSTVVAAKQMQLIPETTATVA